jgi:hypothetical protein
MPKVPTLKTQNIVDYFGKKNFILKSAKKL